MVGDYLQASSNVRKHPIGADGKPTSNSFNKLSRFGSGMMNAGANAMSSAIPTRGMYRRRYRRRDE